MELAGDRPEVRMPSHGVLPRFEAAAVVIARPTDEETRVEPGFFVTVVLPFYCFLTLFDASGCCMLKI